MIRDSASMSVMIETIGSRNQRWLQRKRDDFLLTQDAKHGGRAHRISHAHAGNGSGNCNMPHSIVRQSSRLQHAVSSLSSSSGSSTGNGSGTEEEQKMKCSGEQHMHSSEDKKQSSSTLSGGAKKVSSGSSGNDTASGGVQRPSPNNDFHDYHAPSLEDPLPSGGSSPSSRDIDSDNCVVGGKNMCTDSSSSEEDKSAPQKKRARQEDSSNNEVSAAQAAGGATAVATTQSTAAKPPSLPANIARSGGILHNVKVQPSVPAAMSSTSAVAAAVFSSSKSTTLLPNGHANLSRAPITQLPPFFGIGKRKQPPTSAYQSTTSERGNNISSSQPIATSKPMSIAVPKPPPPIALNGHAHARNNSSSNQREESNNSASANLESSNSTSRQRGHVSNIITIDADSASSQSSSQNQRRGIQAHYHINEDDMILTDDVLMCPFIFRSQEAVWCGSLAECVQPGMLRAGFSGTNKLKNVEMIFDAMGFCQQLERASGNEGMAQIIPNSLEMALAPNSEESRVITLAKKPFPIVSVNEAWTAVTGYTQLDAEGKDLSMLYGERTDEGAGMRNDFEGVAKGICAASTNVHYDINGREFLDFMSSFPLSNLNDEVTHILHVCQELPQYRQ